MGDSGAERNVVFEGLDGGALARHLTDSAPSARGRRRSHHAAVGRAVWLATSVAVLAASVAVAQGGAPGGATSAGNSRGEPVEIQVRNRSRGETGLVTSSDGYSLRLSNTKENGGGGAVYGCRSQTAAPADDSACLYADNLRGGEAFLFRSREGSKVGHFDLGNPAGAPFSTNATGRVENLNADMVDGLHASDLQGQTGPAGPQGPAGPPGPTASGASSNATEVVLTGAESELLSAQITTTVQSRILATASFEVDSNGGQDELISCRLSRGTYNNPISRELVGDIVDGFFDRTFLSISGATVQPAGTYDIKLFCRRQSGDAAAYKQGDLIVWAAAA